MTKTKPRLSIVHHTLKNSGGMERYVFDLINGFLNKKQDFQVICRRADQNMIAPFQEKVKQLPSALLTPQKLKNIAFSNKIERLGLLKNSVSIGPARVPGVDIAIVGGTHQGHINTSKNGKAGFWDRMELKQERAYYQQAKMIIAHSDLMRDELMAFYQVPDEKIRVIYPPVDVQRFVPVDDQRRLSLRQQFGFAKDEVVFLFPSSSHARKGLDVIAPVFANTQQRMVLAVAGSPPPETSEHIRYLGRLDNMPEAYAAADFTILASCYEPFGLVGPESVLCGTPVVLAENIACTSVIADSAKFVFNRENMDSVKQAIQQAFASPKQRLSNPLDNLLYMPNIDIHIKCILPYLSATNI